MCMVNRMRFRFLIVWMVLGGLVGCATKSSQISERNIMPQSWSLEALTDPKECAGIDGVYNNIGAGKIDKVSPLVEVSFNVALGRPMPSARTPETITVAVKDDSALVFTFGERSSASLSQPFRCVEGWYLIERRRSDMYLGDGVNMDYSNLDLALGKSKEGELIVHSIADEKYSSLLVFKSKDSRESWSLFPRVVQKP